MSVRSTWLSSWLLPAGVILPPSTLKALAWVWRSSPETGITASRKGSHHRKASADAQTA
jgi:hypothetical protein